MTRYTEPEKAQAVGLALVAGPKRAAETTGIPMSTIRGWRDSDEFVELRDRSRNDVAQTFWAAIQIGLDEVVAGLKASAPLRDKAIALGILYDKMALLTGQVTSRSESYQARGVADLDEAQVNEMETVLANAYRIAIAEGSDVSDLGEQRRVARNLLDAEIDRRADEAEG